jgi:alkanesulfonate monooxygenase SsuD/methylene tetrahydromethanopterin reductase-like flavin-dependent oxidoreductase (luciferase family)
VKISLFVEIPVPRPWNEGAESEAFANNLDWMELADEAGFHAVWCTEHHFLEEYCHASAPEVFLGAVSQRTKRLRLGHGIVHLPPNINHPARVAERVATLDLVSNGRVEFGTGEASSVAELDGFNVDPGKKREMWNEAVQVAARCMVEEPFTGFRGEHVSMPPRNVVPKPVQKPHPPAWVACTRHSTIEMAAQNAIGALSFSFIGPDECRELVDTYYTQLDGAVPLLPGVNANILFTAGELMCAPTDELADARIGAAGGFFGYGITYYYVWGQHRPGQVNLWGNYLASRDSAAPPSPGATDDRADWQRHGEAAARGPARGGIGSPRRIREWCRRYEDAGVDQLMFLLPPVASDLVMESIQLMGREVLPEFHERDVELVEAKRRRLEPVLEAIEARRTATAPPLDPAYTFGGVPESWDGQTKASEAADAMAKTAELTGKSRGAS